MTDYENKKEHNGSLMEFGFINVNRQPKMYKKIRERSYENIGYGPITLPPFEYDTTGFSMLAPVEWVKVMEDVDKRYVSSALYGLSYLLRHTAPSLCMADLKDVNTDVSIVEEEEQKWKSALFMFDAIEGGVGYSEKIYDKIDDAYSLCLEIIRECDCSSGCPSCVPPLPPGVGNDELENFLIMSNASTVCTESLLTVLLDGKIVLPQIKTQKIPIRNAMEKPPEDFEKKELNRKLTRAAALLKKKRERLH